VLPSLSDQLADELRRLDSRGRLRACPSLAGSSRVNTVVNGHPLLSFCSNDYLGLASHPALGLAAYRAATTSGFGGGASRLVAGDLPEHRDLERGLASLVALPAALLFPTGYQANLGVITALAGPPDLIVADRAVHASLIDACRLSGARLAVYPHLQVEKAQTHLHHFGPKARRRFLLTESLFSMDGDFAPIAQLADLAKDYDAALVVDEAHTLGTLGPRGAGLCAHLAVVPDVLIGTLGKAFGASGAFAAGSELLRDYLVNRARTFIFTTALPPPVAAASLQALSIIRSPEGDALRARLADNITVFRSHLALSRQAFPSPIHPLILGPDDAALSASRHFRSAGLFVQPIRPPAVREGSARLRLTFSAAHSIEDLSRLADAIHSLATTLKPTTLVSNPTGPSISAPPESVLRPVQKPAGIFIAGTDTAVGKTAVSAALLRLLRHRGLRPVPFKPVETGANPSPRDAQALLAASGRTDLRLPQVCPFPLYLPVAPTAAAAAQGLEISLSVLLLHFTMAQAFGDAVIVESAGGLLSPYAPAITTADLAAAFDLPIILVARNSLGTINHTALAISEIRRRGLPFIGTILVNTTPDPNSERMCNSSQIGDLTGTPPLGTLPYLDSPTPDLLADALAESVDLRPVWAIFLT